MNKAVTITVEKQVVKPAQKPATKVAVSKLTDKSVRDAAAKVIEATLDIKTSGSLSGMAASLVTTRLTAEQDAKIKRDEARAKRFPIAAKQEAAEKASKTPQGKEAAKETTKKENAVKAEVLNATFIVRKAQPDQTLHLLDERSRPQNGSRLFAHTHAVFTILGMLDATRPAVPRGQVLQMMGQRAVTYHLAKANFEDAPDRTVRLSVAGRNHFAARLPDGKIDTKAANAFVEMFLDGKIDQSATGIAQQNVYQVKF